MEEETKNEDAETAGSTIVDVQKPERLTTSLTLPAHPLLGAYSGVLRVFRDQNGKGRLQFDADTTVFDLDSPEAEVALLQRIAATRGIPRRQDLRDAVDLLKAYSKITSDVESAWLRVAPTRDGVVIDVADVANTRIWVTSKGVQIRNDKSGPLFCRNSTMRPLVRPSDDGDIKPLRRYLNLSDVEVWLLIAWLTYVLCHPRMASVAFPILVLSGDQGSGKSFLCRLIKALLDASTIEIQTFPRNERDLAIAVQAQFVTVFDNMREVRPRLADILCQVATGGFVPVRKLYTNTDLAPLQLHGALILNSNRPIVNQPDLAQRCLPLRLRSLEASSRLREDQLMHGFQADLPQVFGGLLDLASAILAQLPNVQPTNPERLIAFCHWLAALEAVHGIPAPVYQEALREVLQGGMRDALEEQPLIAAVLSLLDDSPTGEWSDTPSDLLVALGIRVSGRVKGWSDWPQNAISLSKRLKSIQPALGTLRIDVQFGRGKDRRIVLRRMEDDHE